MVKQNKVFDTVFNIVTIYTGIASVASVIFTISFVLSNFNIGFAQGNNDYAGELKARVETLGVANNVAEANLNVIVGGLLMYVCYKIKTKKSVL